MIRKSGVAHYASKGVNIRCNGRSTHVVTPEKRLTSEFSISEIVRRAEYCEKLDSYNGDVLCTVTGINAGTKSFIVHVGDGELYLIIRSYYQDDLEKLQDKIEDDVRSAARKDRITYDILYCEEFPVAEFLSKILEKICDREDISYIYVEPS